MFGIGGTELLIIAVFALLIFGPDKLPQLARTVGRFAREFRRYQDMMESTIRAEIDRADSPRETGETPATTAPPEPPAAGFEDDDEEEDEE